MKWLAAAGILAAVTCPAAAQTQTFRSASGNLNVETVATGLANPWALAFLPDGRMLVTERPGRLRIVTRDGRLSPPVAGLPQISTRGQGGLLDVVPDRNHAQNGTIYFCFAEPMSGGARTSLARARLAAGEAPKLEDMQVIFRQEGPPSSGRHFGCRIVQTPDDNLFLTTGDHGSESKEAQNLANHIGKVIRIRPDGSVPPGNPFLNRQDAKPEIWSYGHRNAQGAALHPQSGKLWLNEHGPRGGDEVNIPLAGKNYGWPVIGYGVDYSGAKMHEGTHKEGMEQPVHHWTPSIAPSGAMFYTGDLFPAWKGNLFTGSLVFTSLYRIELNGEKVVKEEPLLESAGDRIRDVRQAPDGSIWLLTDARNGKVLRLTPAK